MTESDKKILIVGGGTSGWLSAAFLSATLKESYQGNFSVTLVEASDIPTIGVGEATTPSLQYTLSALGVNEFEFMRECDATFKHGIQFNQWQHSPEKDKSDYYFHPFQAGTRVGIDHIARHWANTDPAQRKKFAQIACNQQVLAESGYSPKISGANNFGGPIPYAYHLDAGKLAEYLKKISIKAGVKHIIDKVDHVTIDDQHVISNISFQSGNTFSPDLVIDCTGFSARLINHGKDNPFVNKNDQLFCDRALATRIPVESLESLIPYTKSTAQKNGWIWDINLIERRGIGHVYSSQHCSDDEALKTIAQYIGKKPDELECRELKMRIGYHKKQWRGNCIAVGLSAGFLEPLESTGIYLVEMAVWMLAQFIPRFFEGMNISDRFNFMMERHFENIVDFIKAHYCLSKRRDSQFWIDNVDAATIPDSLSELLNIWRYDFPGDYDFDSNIVCFNSENYQYILYGMTQPNTWANSTAESKLVSAEYMENLESRNRVSLERLRVNLIKHHKVLKKITDKVELQNSNTASMPSTTNYRLR